MSARAGVNFSEIDSKANKIRIVELYANFKRLEWLRAPNGPKLAMVGLINCEQGSLIAVNFLCAKVAQKKAVLMALAAANC